LCFLALPVRSIDPGYETALAAEDRDVVGSGERLELALLSAGRDGSLSANLLAPVVIDLATRRAVQAVRVDTKYSHRHPLNSEERVCS